MEAPTTAQPTKKRKAKATPPEGYVCKLCKTPGHWVYDCVQCVKQPKKPKAPTDTKPNPCVSTEEARVKCHCGLRAMKRRAWKQGEAAPEQRWICARLKKHKIKRGDADLRPCKFNINVEAALATQFTSGAEEPIKKIKPPGRVNARYLQRDRRRQLKRKVFVSGLPFGVKAAEFLTKFFEEKGVVGLERVAALEKGGRKTGQAYATFETGKSADAAVALSGATLDGGRWLEIKRVEEKPKEPRGGEDSSDGSSGEDSDSSSDVSALGAAGRRRREARAAAAAGAAAGASDGDSSDSSEG